MEYGPAEKERETKDLIRRAKGNPDKNGAMRRDALRRLIDLTHSPHPSLKILAAGNIRFFFNDFPELEEAAINAVYDLCEDQSPTVRIEGYTAITQVSKAQNRWVKRNADVLLQLLQSDEPDEVTVVKKALTEHLDMDPLVTLGVLCDQILPLDEPTEEDEQNIRDRLRSLVLAFLTGEAKRAIVTRHSAPGSDAEEVIVNGLTVAIKKLGPLDAAIIVKDILLSLPSYRQRSRRAQDLFQVLLDKAKSSLSSSSSMDMLSYLDLAALLAIDKKIAPALDFLRFYCASFTGKIALQKIPLEIQISVICRTMETLEVCNETESQNSDFLILRRQIVDAAPILFEPFMKFGLPDSRCRNACKILMQSCLQRKNEAGWVAPPNLVNSLRALAELPGCKGSDKQSQDIQNLIRLLVPPVAKLAPQPPSTQNTNTLPGTLEGNDTQKAKNARFPLPEKPPVPTRRMIIHSRTHPTTGSASATSSGLASSSNNQIPSKRDNISVDDNLRPTKKTKQDEGDAKDIAQPSLLSRLDSNGLNYLPNVMLPPKQQSAAQGSVGVNPARHPSDAEKAPVGGYSIKGAAKAGRDPTSVHFNSRPTLASQSLFDRIHNNDAPDEVDDRSFGGWKKRKKGKP